MSTSIDTDEMRMCITILEQIDYHKGPFFVHLKNLKQVLFLQVIISRNFINISQAVSLGVKVFVGESFADLHKELNFLIQTVDTLSTLREQNIFTLTAKPFDSNTEDSIYRSIIYGKAMDAVQKLQLLDRKNELRQKQSDVYDSPVSTEWINRISNYLTCSSFKNRDYTNFMNNGKYAWYWLKNKSEFVPDNTNAIIAMMLKSSNKTDYNSIIKFDEGPYKLYIYRVTIIPNPNANPNANPNPNPDP
jgi:hypothetical protein